MDLEIWSADDLAARIGDEGVIVLDVRRGERFAAGHVPGARNYSVYGINTYDTDPAPLASFVKMWAFQLTLTGITRDHCVVVCGERSDEAATRAAWFLDWLGHPRAALLDGGLQAWVAAGGALTGDATAPKSAPYSPETVRERVATWRDVMVGIYDDDTVILDTRSDEEWFGRDARGSARAGAVPGAVHQEWLAHIDDKGCLLPADVLRQRFEAIGVTPEREVIAYCNTGYRSAHAYVALGMLGYPRVRNYVGSWQEWANRPECPVVVPQPGVLTAPR
jgi:thiosulfate/3-mercaptopyruvate sulfurtransferase